MSDVVELEIRGRGKNDIRQLGRRGHKDFRHGQKIKVFQSLKSFGGVGIA